MRKKNLNAEKLKKIELKINKMRELIYCIVATSGENVISVTARNSENEHAGVFHKLLGVELNKLEIRNVNGTILCDIKKLNDVLSYYENFQ